MLSPESTFDVCSLRILNSKSGKEDVMKESVTLASPLKVVVPIIKVVGDFCNLRCKYCFYNGRDQSIPHVMNDELLEKFLTEYIGLFLERLAFIWHGGEPLLAGLSFFHKIIRFQAENLRAGQAVQNFIQTNATLIDDEWANFFKVHNFKVGVSLDGNQKSHNRFRANRDGRGSFDEVIRGIVTLRKHGIQPGIIQTLTHNNIAHGKEDFCFFANTLGARNWGVNMYLDMGGINKVMSDQDISNGDLIRYLKACIDLWLEQDDPNLRIREIENFISGVLGKRSPSCAFNGSCTSYFCLEYNGEIYPCDRSSNCPCLLFGDLSQHSLSDILNGPARLKYIKRVNSIRPECAHCKWYNACHNGCAMQRIGGIDGKYYYCQTRRAIFPYLQEKIARHRDYLKDKLVKIRENDYGSKCNRGRSGSSRGTAQQ